MEAFDGGEEFIAVSGERRCGGEVDVCQAGLADERFDFIEVVAERPGAKADGPVVTLNHNIGISFFV